MNDLRQRYDAVKLADDSRNALLEDLLRKVDEQQKIMDRNAFALVLIDGDCMNFLDDLVKMGTAGGEEAAKTLRQKVFDHLKYDNNFKLDHKITIRVYANLRGLSKTYVDKGILATVSGFADFVLGFNKAHPLCDFIDAGNHKEAADTKLKEILTMHVYNVHCKHIIFGASADNAYASFLSSSFEADIATRIILLEGPPFAFEFRNIISRFSTTQFPTVFKDTLLKDDKVKPRSAVLERDLIDFDAQSRSTPGIDQSSASQRATYSGPVATTLPNRSRKAWPVNDGASSEDEDERSTSSSTKVEIETNPITQSGSDVPMTDTEYKNAWQTLRKCTRQQLELTPLALDFAKVKATAAAELGKTSEWWGSNDSEPLYKDSKQVIKDEIEDWIIETDNPPPKNATWILRYFVMDKRPPAEIMLELRAGRRPVQSVDSSSILTPDASDALQLETYRPSESRYGNWLLRSIQTVHLNDKGERVDYPTKLNPDRHFINKLRDRQPRLCNHHYLLPFCATRDCPYEHDHSISNQELEALAYLSRGQPCPASTYCQDNCCVRGHMCPDGRNCWYGSRCKFVDTHDMDTKPASVLR